MILMLRLILAVERGEPSMTYPPAFLPGFLVELGNSGSWEKLSFVSVTYRGVKIDHGADSQARDGIEKL